VSFERAPQKKPQGEGAEIRIILAAQVGRCYIEANSFTGRTAMAITLYHDVPSSNSDRVKIALAEKGLQWAGVRVRLAYKEQKKPEFLKLNPYGKIPVIVEDGNVLFESCIINEYLEEKYPDPPLMPKNPYWRGRGRVLIDYALNYAHPPYWDLRAEMRKPEAERNAKVAEEKQRQLRALLEYLEAAVGDKNFFLGDFSLADIAIIPRFVRAETYGALPASGLPRLSAWLRRMKERPSVKAIL
jgi:glutathione S-transferase